MLVAFQSCHVSIPDVPPPPLRSGTKNLLRPLVCSKLTTLSKLDLPYFFKRDQGIWKGAHTPPPLKDTKRTEKVCRRTRTDFLCLFFPGEFVVR